MDAGGNQTIREVYFIGDQAWVDIRGGVCGGVRSEEEAFVLVCAYNDSTLSPLVVERLGEVCGDGGAVICARSDGGSGT